MVSALCNYNVVVWKGFISVMDVYGEGGSRVVILHCTAIGPDGGAGDRDCEIELERRSLASFRLRMLRMRSI